MIFLNLLNSNLVVITLSSFANRFASRFSEGETAVLNQYLVNIVMLACDSLFELTDDNRLLSGHGSFIALALKPSLFKLQPGWL